MPRVPRASLWSPALLLAGGLAAASSQVAGNALHRAARAGDLEAVRAAIVAGADVNAPQPRFVDFSAESETALFAAAEAGHAEVVRYLLEAGADPDIRCIEDGTALTIAAASTGTVEAIRLLLESGADVLGPRPKGLMALGWSARFGDLDSFLLLLDASRRAGMVLDDRNHILDSLDHRHDELRHVMKRVMTWEPEKVPLLHVVTRNGTAAEVQAQLALADGASAVDEDGWTALHWAALSDSALKGRLLLAAGANPNAQTSGGCTPLMLTARSEGPEFAALLLDGGADPNAADESGRTALHVAAWNSGPEMIWLLLDHQADPTKTLSTAGQTPAKLAEYRKKNLGVDVRWAFEGRTAPAYATRASQVELVSDGPTPVIELAGAEIARSPDLPFALVEVFMRVDPFQRDLAFEVSLRQGHTVHSAGPLFLSSGKSVNGLAFQLFAFGLEPGPIEVLLRPNRDVAMRKQTQPTAIWGEEVVLRCELVEKP